MTVEDQASLVFIVTIVFYFAAIIGLIFRGWPFRAGLVSFLIACLPLLWQGVFTESDAPGFGVLFIFMAPIPLLLMTVGLGVGVIRAVLRRRSDRRP